MSESEEALYVRALNYDMLLEQAKPGSPFTNYTAVQREDGHIGFTGIVGVNDLEGSSALNYPLHELLLPAGRERKCAVYSTDPDEHILAVAVAPDGNQLRGWYVICEAGTYSLVPLNR